jgi:hypothetical protein
VTISHWPGHASPNTTHRYGAIDLETKRAALAKARPTDAGEASARRLEATILEWLAALQAMTASNVECAIQCGATWSA